MKKKNKEIYVTKTYLPPLNDYIKDLRTIWKTSWVTNHGPLVEKLEKKLKEYLNVKHLFFINNGTTALQIAVKALDLKGGEVITTPFSYIATTSSLIWENCKPVFVDIDKNSLCINPSNIEKAITKKTKAIMAVHVYGNPCDVYEIEQVAKKFNLKVIYDAAHAFGVRISNKPILHFGDCSVLSFHATKVFHTVEGGAIATQDAKLAQRISFMRNFGHKGYEDFFGLGINGKNCEFHAAMGLRILPTMKNVIGKRKRISKAYDKFLNNEKIRRLKVNEDITFNYGYYPVIFESQKRLLKIKKELNNNNIFPRRYFYPSLNLIEYVKNYCKNSCCPISEDISKRVLCLPLYSDLTFKDVKKISMIISKQVSNL